MLGFYAIRPTRHFPHPPGAVWKALTTPELLARWWAPGDIAPNAGHRFTLDMGAWGIQQCEVLSVDPGTSISFLFAVCRRRLGHNHRLDA
ncbi:SRPBCC domain-containing protein [Arthrobacter sp. ISL-65]|uniref:SRPBCC family protein n=1 Tax=Arthrobacter sp. ISL-65 TaxID=2819112 RepID=UPI00203521FD|nr:SRPBCC domain-containing protein [Arthrobacter sp. ISL-65]